MTTSTSFPSVGGLPPTSHRFMCTSNRIVGVTLEWPAGVYQAANTPPFSSGGTAPRRLLYEMLEEPHLKRWVVGPPSTKLVPLEIFSLLLSFGHRVYHSLWELEFPHCENSMSISLVVSGAIPFGGYMNSPSTMLRSSWSTRLTICHWKLLLGSNQPTELS